MGLSQCSGDGWLSPVSGIAMNLFPGIHWNNLSFPPSLPVAWKWSECVSVTALPALAAHGCAVIGRKVYMFGGLGPDGASDTLYCLDTG